MLFSEDMHTLHLDLTSFELLITFVSFDSGVVYKFIIMFVMICIIWPIYICAWAWHCTIVAAQCVHG